MWPSHVYRDLKTALMTRLCGMQKFSTFLHLWLLFWSCMLVRGARHILCFWNGTEWGMHSSAYYHHHTNSRRLPRSPVPGNRRSVPPSKGLCLGHHLHMGSGGDLRLPCRKGAPQAVACMLLHPCWGLWFQRCCARSMHVRPVQAFCSGHWEFEHGDWYLLERSSRFPARWA